MGLYDVVTRVSAIAAIATMAIAEIVQHFYANDIFYTGAIVAIVIGPHALDELASRDKGRIGPAAASAVRILIPVVGIGLSLFRFFMVAP